MAGPRRSQAPPPRESRHFDPEGAARAKERLQRRISELKALKRPQPDYVSKTDIALDNARSTVRDVFGEHSDESSTFWSALIQVGSNFTLSPYDEHYDREEQDRDGASARIHEALGRLENLSAMVDEKTIRKAASLPDEPDVDAEILNKLREQLRLFPETARDAGFRSLTGPGAQWVARTSVLIGRVDATRGKHFQARGTDLLRVGAGVGAQDEFMSLLAEVKMLLEVEIARLAEESPKELEQKFRVLLSAQQAVRDFDEYRGRLGHETPIGVLFVDLDHFGDLNAKFTEEIVDQDFLPVVMRVLRDFCVERGSVYRQGGDEFLVLMPNTDLEEARAFADRLRLKLRQEHFVIAEEPLTITASIGVTCSEPHDPDFAAVRGRANMAKKEAKATRDCVRLLDGRAGAGH